METRNGFNAICEANLRQCIISKIECDSVTCSTKSQLQDGVETLTMVGTGMYHHVKLRVFCTRPFFGALKQCRIVVCGGGGRGWCVSYGAVADVCHVFLSVR